mmetsp:Transcript_13715/g.27695  ORF Transcript_13715/g.27695 Transcript_13715/m.27695 type:complete len:343 (+) Transcript_13715:73-1101(+)
MMFITERYLLLPFLATLTLVHCAGAFAFQQKLPVSTTKVLALAAAESEDALIASASVSESTASRKEFHWDNTETQKFKDANAKNDADDDSPSSQILSRRKAVSTSLSMLTVAACLPLREAFASSDTTAEAIQQQQQQQAIPTTPFRVLFTIQIDPSKPDDELSELEIEVRPDWAPLAANRFKQLVELGFYQDSPLFRVLPNYVAQFGISSDPALNKEWMYCDAAPTDEEARKNCKEPLPDEPRKQPNNRGTLAFASSGKNSRRTQVFVNLANNGGPPNFLDAQGFVPFAQIVRGMDGDVNVPKKFNSEYGGKVNQGKGAYYGAKYFETVFPRLSIIKNAKVL